MAREFRLAFHPSDRTLLALLTLSAAVALLRWPALGAPLTTLVAVQRFQTPTWIEFFSFIYGAFIPYIDLRTASRKGRFRPSTPTSPV